MQLNIKKQYTQQHETRATYTRQYMCYIYVTFIAIRKKNIEGRQK